MILCLKGLFLCILNLNGIFKRTLVHANTIIVVKYCGCCRAVMVAAPDFVLRTQLWFDSGSGLMQHWKPWIDFDSAINLHSQFKKAKGHNVKITKSSLQL